MPAIALLLAIAADYAGAAACAPCHPAQSAAQSATGHARALAPSTADQPGQWAFGAGHQAITFVRQLDPDTYLEEPRTWYRRIDAYAPTPGAATPAATRYRLFAPDAGILRCFACHSTGPLTLADGQAIQPHENGVHCEACHGPAAAHLADPVRSRPVNPARYSADQLNALCGNCHRMPAGPDDTPDLRNPWNVRHQPLLLAASACFKQSKGRLSCLTCHSPHAPLEEKPTVYNAACAKCHTGVRHAQPIAGRACAGCHMPTVKPTPQLAFANHRIAIYTPANPLSPVPRRRP